MPPRYPSSLAPNSIPPGMTRGQKSRARREPSGAFQLFQAPQIQQFKEAFSLIDQDGDGIVSEKDLKAVFSNLGLTPTPTMLDSLLSARPGNHFRGPSASEEDDSMPDRGVNFPMFLTMMGERLFEFDSEAELVEAFECFDENDTGTVKVDEVRKWLGEMGDRMSEEEIDRLLKGPFTDRQGNFKYREWVKVVRVNEETEEADVR
ncbi:EF-hand [Phellopilus nigrolimitatus]|nr:EF-hand [Phellopilus nigrolimitatus]